MCLFLQVKTQLQSQSNATIAVGTQHNIQSIPTAFRDIYRKHGVVGLWRGNSAIVARVSAGSAVQLTAFSKCKDVIVRSGWIAEGSMMVPVASSLIAGEYLNIQCFLSQKLKRYNV